MALQGRGHNKAHKEELQPRAVLEITTSQDFWGFKTGLYADNIQEKKESAIGSTQFNRHYSLKPEEIQPDPACYAPQLIFQMHFFSLVVNYNTRKFDFMCSKWL